jgi:hypothetical protein
MSGVSFPPLAGRSSSASALDISYVERPVSREEMQQGSASRCNSPGDFKRKPQRITVAVTSKVKLADLPNDSETPNLWKNLGLLKDLDKNLEKVVKAKIPFELCVLSNDSWRHTLLLKSGALAAVKEIVLTCCDHDIKQRRRMSLGRTGLEPVQRMSLGQTSPERVQRDPSPQTVNPIATLEHCAKIIRNFAASDAKLAPPITQQLVESNCVNALLSIVNYMGNKKPQKSMPKELCGQIQFYVSGAFNAIASDKFCRVEMVNLMVVPAIIELAVNGDLPTKSQCVTALAKFSCEPRNIARMARQDVPKAFVDLFHSQVPQIMHVAVAGVANFFRENEHFENQIGKALFQGRYLNMIEIGVADFLCKRWPEQDLACIVSTTFCLASISTDHRCHSQLYAISAAEYAINLIQSPLSPVGKHETREEKRQGALVAEQCAILLTNLSRTLQASMSSRPKFRQCLHDMSRHALPQVRECASLIFGYISSGVKPSVQPNCDGPKNASMEIMKQKHAIADLESAVKLFMEAGDAHSTSGKKENVRKTGVQRRNAALSILNMILTGPHLHSHLCSSKEVFKSFLSITTHDDDNKVNEDCVEIVVVLATSSTLTDAMFVFMIECNIVDFTAVLCTKDKSYRCKGVDIILGISEHEAVRNKLVDFGAIEVLKKSVQSFSLKDAYQAKCARLAHNLSLSDRQEALVAQGMVNISLSMLPLTLEMPKEEYLGYSTVLEVATFAVRALANLSFNKESREAFFIDTQSRSTNAQNINQLTTAQETKSPASNHESPSLQSTLKTESNISILRFLVKVGMETSPEDFSTLQSISFAAKNLSYVNGKEEFIVQEGLVSVLVRAVRLFSKSSAVCKYVAIAMANLSTDLSAACQVTKIFAHK